MVKAPFKSCSGNYTDVRTSWQPRNKEMNPKFIHNGTYTFRLIEKIGFHFSSFLEFHFHRVWKFPSCLDEQRILN